MEGQATHFSRRHALWLAGAAGLGAVSACSSHNSTATATHTPPPAETTVAPPTSVAPPPKAVTAQVLCRQSWGALAPLPGEHRTNGAITRLTIHHTAVVLGDNNNAPGRLRQHQRFHQNSRGWFDIAYHLSVDRNGNIYELRDPRFAGDTATNYDPAGHFLVVCEGDFDQEQVTPAQLEGAARAFAWASQEYRVSPEILDGHKDNSHDTACPGTTLYDNIAWLRARVAELNAAGGVERQDICGDEARHIVSSVENGTQPPLYQ